jgi:dipeptidyl aminopeptidase/acylaminoacyl peptidase
MPPDSSGPPLVPRREYFANSRPRSPQISPDGTRLAFVAPLDGVPNLWVASIHAPERATPVTSSEGQPIVRFCWARTNAHLLYYLDNDGDEQWQLYSIDLESRRPRNLTPLPEAFRRRRPGQPPPAYPRSVELLHCTREKPTRLIVSISHRDPWHGDVYEVDLVSGDKRLIRLNHGFRQILCDRGGRLRVATVQTHTGTTVLRLGENGDSAPLLTIPRDGYWTTSLLHLDDDDQLYLLDSTDRDRAALTVVNLETKERRTLALDLFSDVEGVFADPLTGKPVAAYVYHPYVRFLVLDSKLAAELHYVHCLGKLPHPGHLSVVSSSDDGRHWVMQYSRDDTAPRFFLYNRQWKELTPLFQEASASKDRQAVPMRTTVIRSRDGLPLVVYLTLPRRGARPNVSASRRKVRAPLVLLVHGGPWARDYWGYEPSHQWLADRGYAALSVNFRGSTGFGKRFLMASLREWGQRMQSDLVDAVAWAVGAGIADPRRVAIMGGSYGGYAALMALATSERVFACAVDCMGMSSLIRSSRWFRSDFLGVESDTEEGRLFLEARSPLHLVEQIRKPVLIAHGANDSRVWQEESDNIVAALVDLGRPVTYFVYPDEGHGFARPRNKVAFYAVVEAFLARHLGGRLEPIDDDLAGSSVEVHAGIGQIPELARYLSARVRIAIAERTRARVLDLSSLNLAALPPEIVRLQQLEELNLEWNHLRSLPAELARLPSLRKLLLAGNPIQRWTRELDPLAERCDVRLDEKQRIDLGWDLPGRDSSLVQMFRDVMDMEITPEGRISESRSIVL